MPQPIPSALRERLDRLRTGILLDLPFFGSLIVRMPFVRDDAFATMATDGVSIKLNAAWSMACDDNELRYTVAHELMHPALGHLWRLEDRDLDDFNRACDYVVNQMLDDYAADAAKIGQACPWTRPKNFLTVEGEPEYRGLSAEQIYAQIRKKKQEPPPDQGQPQPGNGGGQGQPQTQPGPGQPDPNAPSVLNGQPGTNPHPSAPGSFVSPPPYAGDPQPDKEAGAANLEDDWKIAAAQAETIAQMRGNCPGAASRTVNGLKQAQVSWREVLREFIRRSARDDYGWIRVNQRHLARGFILPALHSERMGRLVCAVDTSGSIDHEILAEFQAEVQAALDELRPEAVEIIVCDAKVHATQRFEPGEEVLIDAKGGGGTDFRPVFTQIEGDKEHDEPPAALVYFTDLQGTFPNTEPEYPVLWAGYQTRGHTPPWGELVKVS